VLKEFKEFVFKASLIEIAIGLILALAVKAVVDSLVADVITPIIAAAGGQPNFDSLVLDIGDGQVLYGRFINTIVSLVVIGFVLFLIVKAYNTVLERTKRRGDESEVTEPGEDVMLLREIRDVLRQRQP
jgi:large conductance mechanosensitive channel